MDYSSQTNTLVFVGDHIDHGANNCETVVFLHKLQHQVGKDNYIYLRGSYEQVAIDAFTSGDNSLWFYNDGHPAVCSYDRNGVDIESDVGWFRALSLMYDIPEIIFCYAGLSKPSLKDSTAHDLIWGRDWIRHNDHRPREKQMIFRHTPSRTGTAYTITTDDICINSACAYGGRLCVLAVNENGNGKPFYADKSEEGDESLQGIS